MREIDLLLAARWDDALAAPNDPATQAWVEAFIACAQGRFDEAIVRGRVALETPTLVHAASLTVGSALRQSGRYLDAEALEEAALALTTDPQGAAHLVVSLAADAVGLGDRVRCFRRLELAVSLVDVPEPRLAVRHAWVSAEFALLDDAPDVAVTAAERALAASAGMPRHLAKSLLFLGVAHATDAVRRSGSEAHASREQARLALERSRDEAAHIGASPIVDVATSELAHVRAG